MRYLAVDSDGTEWIFGYDIERHFGTAKYDSNQLLCYEDLKNNKKDFWTMKPLTNWCAYANRIELPKGSIEKLIGKSLSWADDAVFSNIAPNINIRELTIMHKRANSFKYVTYK